MQNYQDLAAKNGVELLAHGPCQFCGAQTTRGVHECIEIFNLGFEVLDYSKLENCHYRFLSVDAHALQHPEIHGRWNNHFHLTQQHLMLHHQLEWSYALSPMLSDYLNQYKATKSEEYLHPPKPLERGGTTTTHFAQLALNQDQCRSLIQQWAEEVYHAWSQHHAVVEKIARGFLQQHR